MTNRDLIRFKNLFFTLSLALSFSSAIAFEIDPTNEKGAGVIRGTLKDAQTGEPVEFASVALFSSEGDIKGGVISSEEGQFRFKEIEPGVYYIEISSVGYLPKQIQKIELNEENAGSRLGLILLERDVQTLEEVEVVAEKSAIEYQIDKKVINVDQQITGKSGTAVDILMNVPSVTVDIDGSVALRGSTGFMVLIDGRPTILESSDALQQIPANSIENIEIITNPSAKYNPDGTAGIINIVTKKEKREGVTAIANGNVGWDNKYSGDILVNHTKKKWTSFIGADFNQRYFPGFTEGERLTEDNDTLYGTSYKGENYSDRFFWNVRGGIGFNPTKKDVFNLELNYGYRKQTRGSDLDYREWIEPNTFIDSYLSKNEHSFDMDFYSVNLSYQHNFQKKHYLRANLSIRNRDIREYSLNALIRESGNINSGQRVTEIGPAGVIQTDLEYSRSIGIKGKFEAGYQSRIGSSTDDTRLYDYDTALGDFVYQDTFSNYTEYNRDIHAVYALFGNQKGRFGYQFGIRGEYTYRTINSSVSTNEFRIDRLDYFPSGHLSYKLGNEQELMASYSRRIERPRSWWLEPFITVVDAFNVRQGNPNLKPEYVDSFELNYRKGFGKNFLSVEAYYRITKNKVERIREVFTTNVIKTFPENVGTDYFLGTEIALSLRLTKWWKLDASGNIFHYSIRGTLNDQPYFRESFNWNTRMNNNFTIKKNTRIQVSSRYVSGTATAQGSMEGFFGIDAALGHNFMKKKMTTTLQLRNILQTERRLSRSEGVDFVSRDLRYLYGPIAILTLTYRFNNFKEKRKKQQSSGGSIGNDDF